jgi:hypothetical protein
VIAGFRDGRSPDVLAATGAGRVASADGSRLQRWPSVDDGPPEVPIALLGSAVRPEPIPAGTRLDAIAPTLEGILGVDRPFPGVRSGTAIEGLARDDGSPLAVVVVWKDVGSSDLADAPEAWPWLRGAMHADGAFTLHGSTGSLPVDPAAALTTIGTGGLPFQHGITGERVRTDSGRVAEAFGRAAPLPVIATFAEDLDERTGQRSRVGLVATSERDRGLVGGSWYPGADRDDVTIGARDPAEEVERLLAAGYGEDADPDLLAVTVSGTVRAMDRATRDIVERVRDEVPAATIVVTATGSVDAGLDPERGEAIVAGVERTLGAPATLVDAIAAGGLFLDEPAVAATGIGADEVASTMLGSTTAAGAPLFADAYPAYAVSLSRYC